MHILRLTEARRRSSGWHVEGIGVIGIGCRTGETVWRELPASAWQGDNLSGSFHSPSLVPRSDSVRMTGVCGVRDERILVETRARLPRGGSGADPSRCAPRLLQDNDF